MRGSNKDTSVEEILLHVNLDRKVGLPDVGTRKRACRLGPGDMSKMQFKGENDVGKEL